MARKRKKVISLAVIGMSSSNVDLGIADVPDPYEPGRSIRVMKNHATHPLDHLLARGRVSADQKAAGDAFLMLYERAEIGGAKAIDYSRVKVDVSFEHKGLDPKIAEAIAELATIQATVGQRFFKLLWDVVGCRRSIMDLASERDRGHPSLRTKRSLNDMLCMALDDLTDHFEVRAQGRARGRIRAEIISEAA